MLQSQMVESFVIHIYRRGEAAGAITGTIERVGNETRQHFETIEELWSYLSDAQRQRRRSPPFKSDGSDR